MAPYSSRLGLQNMEPIFFILFAPLDNVVGAYHFINNPLSSSVLSSIGDLILPRLLHI